jgi:two-component system chemotaxis response regulator CheB
MNKIRVLLVDDSAVIRRLLTDTLANDPEIEVIGMAGNGEIALAKIEQLKPDIITLDIEMPVMDGLSTLRALRKIHPKLPVIMFSTLTERGSTATMDALALGASDYVAKPANVGGVLAGMDKIRDDLIPKIKALCHRAPPPKPTTQSSLQVNRAPRASVASGSGVEILAVGVSTGGPNALAEFIPALGRRFPVPIVIVQHMPPLFTRLLAERLAAVSGLLCKEGFEGAMLRPGELWIAPGGFHMEVEKAGPSYRLRLTEEPPENSCRPAVDVLFRSVAKVFGPKTLAVVLTGMGQDGMRGAEHIRAAGGVTLVQDEASSVVWGMPGAVASAGLAEKILPLKELAAEVVSRVQPPSNNSSEMASQKAKSVFARPELPKQAAPTLSPNQSNS